MSSKNLKKFTFQENYEWVRDKRVRVSTSD